MKTFYIVSAVGKDRPGLVNRITHVIHEQGGNIELQRSTWMAAEFALLLLYSNPEDHAGQLDALKALNGPNLYVNARSVLGGETERNDSARGVQLTASGADQPGIVDAVTLLLFREQINIESMDYDTESAPMSGDELFRLKARLTLPEGADLKTLRSQLRELEDEYNFDILIEQEHGRAG
ncbi:MAG: ACT domain-containing protein [Verrucomicrobiota bacterium]